MPRFNESYVEKIKKVLLKRAPECIFTNMDVLELMGGTGLNEPQILAWADHFRFRTPLAARADDLAKPAEAGRTKGRRFYASCFNVTPGKAFQLKIPKDGSANLYPIDFMSAAFDADAESGEFYFELSDSIAEGRLLAALEQLGADQAYVRPLPGDESASDALLRIMLKADETGHEYTCGTCSHYVEKKALAKMEHPELRRAEARIIELQEEVARLKASDESTRALLAELRGVREELGKRQRVD